LAFKLQKLKGGFFQIIGLEAFLQRRLEAMQRNARLSPPKEKVARKQLISVRTARIAGGPKAPSPLDVLVTALEAHPRRSDLIKAGKRKDQLLRSLIPLYLVRSGAGISSGVTSKFWQAHGLKYAAPNAAKALREHKGYAKAVKGGRQITSAGVKYVEGELKALKASRPARRAA
jgi:hypothetical protein